MAVPALPRYQQRRLLYLFYCLTGSILVIAVLSFFSNEASHRKNGFIRLVPPHIAIPAHIRDLHANVWNLAGGTATRVYLSNRAAPARLMEINLDLKDSMLRNLSIHSAATRVSKSLRVMVDSPTICLAEGVSPLLAEGRLGDSLLHRLPANAYFGLATPLSPASHILRVFDTRLGQNILIKQLPDTLISKAPILEKQADGLFCTDGALHAQPDSNRLVYIYSYRNQFICLDTNLRVRYSARTIDTVSHVQFTVSKIPSQKAVTFSSPPSFVNEQSCVNGNYLFVHSALPADNEDAELFRTGAAIDVYSLVDGSYLFSFYLPDYRNKKMRDFRVFGNTLVALYDHYVYTYTLKFPSKLKK